jgi:hypothetical protein
LHGNSTKADGFLSANRATTCTPDAERWKKQPKRDPEDRRDRREHAENARSDCGLPDKPSRIAAIESTAG